MSNFPTGDLLRTVAKVQHDKTLQAVRDLVASLPTSSGGSEYSRDFKAFTAVEFKRTLNQRLQDLRDEP